MAIMQTTYTTRKLVHYLAEGGGSCERLVEDALQKAKQTDSVFIRINDDALEQAARIDHARATGAPLPALAGLPVTVKDLFNVQGQRTLAGSKAMLHEVVEEKVDAVVVGHMRNAGILFLGRTNMSEFAFSGMGLNPHYGTPKSIWDRETGRLPGGSSSGSAVSVAEGIVPATIGSDTAGSCRIPAAFNGIVGVKPSYGRISLRGVFPLSPTSDAPGPLANDVDGCFLLDHVMMGRLKHGEPLPEIPARDPRSIHLLVPESVVMDALDEDVEREFNQTLAALRDAGVKVKHGPMPVLDACVDMFGSRAVALYEAWSAHRERIERYGDEYDPFVSNRMRSGRNIDEAEQQARYDEKAGLIAEFNQQIREARVDALIFPTVMCVPPAISETRDVEHIAAVNLRCLRNTATVNYFDGCALSLPCHQPEQAPVGLTIAASNGEDAALYEISATLETVTNTMRNS